MSNKSNKWSRRIRILVASGEWCAQLQYWANIMLEQDAVQRQSEYEVIQSCNYTNKVSFINDIHTKTAIMIWKAKQIWETYLQGLCTSMSTWVTRTLIAITRSYNPAFVSPKQALAFLSDESGKPSFTYPWLQELHHVNVNLGEDGNRQSHFHHFNSMVQDSSGKGICPSTGSQRGSRVWEVERALWGSRPGDVSNLN